MSEKRPTGNTPHTVSIDYAPVADLYDAFARFEEDIPFFVEAARRTAGPVLELMAGTGRITLPLLKAGVHLTSVDYSPALLSVLRGKLAREKLRGRVLLADVRSMPFHRTFQLAVLPFHAFAELTTEVDRQRALRSTHAALGDRGQFICTLHNPPVRLRAIDGRLRTVGRFPHPSGRGEVMLRTKLQFDPDTRLVTGVQLVDEYDGEDNLRTQRCMEIRFALPDRDVFERLATAAGFEVEAIFGDYQRRAYDAGESPFMIWVLRR